jgi:hypothetical protein
MVDFERNVMSKINQNDLKAICEVIKLLPILTTFAKTPTMKKHYEDVSARLQKILDVLNRAITSREKTPMFKLLEDDLVDKVFAGVNNG